MIVNEEQARAAIKDSGHTVIRTGNIGLGDISVIERMKGFVAFLVVLIVILVALGKLK